MKGVSAVIAVILILMIVVALAALAYTWFTGIFSSLTETAGTSITDTTVSMSKQFALDAVGCDGTTLDVAVRNTGSATLNPNLVNVYLNGVDTGATTTDTLGPGEVAAYTVDPTGGCASTDVVRVTIENGVSNSVTLP